MTRSELIEIIAHGENSSVEFQRDTLDNRSFAPKVMRRSRVAGCAEAG